MSFKLARQPLLVIASFALTGPGPGPAGAADISLTTGVDYSTGRYGGTASTEIWYVPITLKWEGERSTLKATVPWVRVKSPTGGTIIDVDANGQPIYSGAGASSTQQGMGDVSLAYSWSMFPQPTGGVLLDLGAKIKLATADESKGLGSGRNDYAVQADAYLLKGDLTPFATLGYRMPGDPAGLTLRNQWFTSLGLGYKLSTTDSVGMMWDLRQASRSTSQGSNEATLYWVHKFKPDFKLQTYLVHGFSEVSPDWGLGLMATALF